MSANLDDSLVRCRKRTSKRIPASSAPLSATEQEILSICLHSQEDPREIGVLPALLSMEKPAGGPP